MDPLEKWYRDHREELDSLEPDPASWTNLQASLHPDDRMPGRGWKIAGALVIAITLLLSLTFFLTDKKQVPPATALPDIQLLSPSGEMLALSSLKGKVVLLEFWASWCDVCREANCNDLLPIYDRYKDQNFEIYAVSLDSVSEEWILGIERDSLPWIQVSDLKGFASPVSQSYGIHKTHTTFLLDEHHHVIGKNLSREELEQKLNACFRSE